MEVHYPESQATYYKKILAQPLFFSLVDYFSERQGERVILRELKKQFPEKGLEHLIDQMVDAHLMERSDRRYQLTFPVYKKPKLPIELNEKAKQLAETIQSLSDEQKAVILGEQLWTLCFSVATPYFYASEEKKQEYEKRSAGNESIQFVTISKKTDWSLTLPNYFGLQREQQSLPKSFAPLAQKIGDVNEPYFFDQVEVLLERAAKGKSRVRRENIFLDALLLTGALSEQEGLQLELPMIENDNWQEIPKEKLPEFLYLENERNDLQLLKQLFFESVMDQVGLTEYTYIRKEGMDDA